MSTLDRRRSEIGRYTNLDRERGLEIGPLDSPVLTKDEANIRYLDYLTRDELVERHSDRRRVDDIVALDYVISNKPLASAIGERFDYVIACHVLEHVPNMIGWLG